MPLDTKNSHRDATTSLDSRTGAVD